MGVTGARADLGDAAETLVARVRAVDRPAGLRRARACRNGGQAAEVAAFADGVIVGSAFVRALLDGRGADGVRALSADLSRRGSGA